MQVNSAIKFIYATLSLIVLFISFPIAFFSLAVIISFTFDIFSSPTGYDLGINIASIIVILCPLIISISIIRYCLNLRKACKYANLFLSELNNGTRTYEDFTTFFNLKPKKFEKLITICVEKNLIYGITLITSRQSISVIGDVPKESINEQYQVQEQEQNQKQEERYISTITDNTSKLKIVTLSCRNCGANYTSELLERERSSKCEYCGSIAYITR